MIYGKPFTVVKKSEVPSAVEDTPKIYGVLWEGANATDSSLRRTNDSENFPDPIPYYVGAITHSSPFDNIMPWAGMERVTDEEAGELVSIPKFWYKLTDDGNNLSIQITNESIDGFYTSPMHMDRGDGKGERDVAYIGRYNCSSSTWKSETDVTPKSSITRLNARSNIRNLGDGIFQYDFAARFTIWLLYIVEFANWDSQRKIGWGCHADGYGSSGGSKLRKTGYTDSMPYHTGRDQDSAYAGGGTQYRNIEGLWDNCYEYLDGCYHNDSEFNIILNPYDFNDSKNGSFAFIPERGYPSVFSISSSAGFPVFYPRVSVGNYAGAEGSQLTTTRDVWNYSSSSPCVDVGGYFDGDSYGLFNIGSEWANYTYVGLGCRLMKLP